MLTDDKKQANVQVDLTQADTVLCEKCSSTAKMSNVFQKTRARTPVHSGPLDFLGFSILRYVCVFCVGLGTFSVILLHFPQKYRCVPKIGFPAGILMNMYFLIVFIWSIVVYLKLGSRLTFLLTFSLTFV